MFGVFFEFVRIGWKPVIKYTLDKLKGKTEMVSEIHYSFLPFQTPFPRVWIAGLVVGRSKRLITWNCLEVYWQSIVK